MIDVIKQLVEALELVDTEFVCNGAHHAKKDRHELGETCPIVERYEEAIQAGRQAIKELESQKPQGVQVSPIQFVESTFGKGHLVGRPVIWAEWPSREKNT